MAKRIVLALLIAALVAGGAFAQVELSAGIGGTFTAAFENYSWTSDGKDLLKASNTDDDIYNTNRIGGGFFAYFDATYAMLSLGMSFFDISPANSDMKKDYKDAKYSESFTTFDIALYGKFPIDLGGFTLFPLLGAEAKIGVDFTANQDGTKYKWSDFTDDSLSEWTTTVWFKAGIGADIPLGDSLYLRPVFLYGIGTNDKGQKETLDEGYMKDYLSSIINHGLDIKLALGYKF